MQFSLILYTLFNSTMYIQIFQLRSRPAAIRSFAKNNKIILQASIGSVVMRAFN